MDGCGEAEDAASVAVPRSSLCCRIEHRTQAWTAWHRLKYSKMVFLFLSAVALLIQVQESAAHRDFLAS